MEDALSINVPRLRFATQLLLLQLAVVLAIVAMSTTIFAISGIQRLQDEAKSTALAVAQSIAEDIDVRERVDSVSRDPGTPRPEELTGGPLSLVAQAVQRRTGALFVVITDDHGIRLAHPNPDELGKVVSTSPDDALAGRETVSWETGTLGESARAKVPVFSPDGGRVVGEVSVGFARERVFDSVLRDSIPVILAALLALILGVAASLLIKKRLQRLTLDLQPEEIVTLVHNQEAVLSGVDEGVIGLTREGKISVCNDSAAHIFDVSVEAGRHVSELGLPPRLMRILAETPIDQRVDAVTLVLDRRVVFADIRPVFRNGVCLGRVIAVRDRTDVEALTRRLDAVASMTTALRAQRHEFANRLHTISGLLAIDKLDEAQSYLSNILSHGPLKYPVVDMELLAEPYLQAFIGAKGIEAREKGVSLVLGPETFVAGKLEDAEDATAVLGNLIDNAIAAAVRGSERPAWVEVELLDAGGDLHVSVLDSGDGVVAGVAAGVERGRDSRLGADLGVDLGAEMDVTDAVRGLGFGLPLCRDIARRRGGDVWFVPSEGGVQRGALFCARLPNIMIPSLASTEASGVS